MEHLRNYYLSGSTYKKDGTKQTKIIETASRKKIKQYKAIVGEDVATRFYQKITGGVKDEGWTLTQN